MPASSPQQQKKPVHKTNLLYFHTHKKTYNNNNNTIIINKKNNNFHTGTDWYPHKIATTTTNSNHKKNYCNSNNTKNITDLNKNKKKTKIDNIFLFIWSLKFFHHSLLFYITHTYTKSKQQREVRRENLFVRSKTTNN